MTIIPASNPTHAPTHKLPPLTSIDAKKTPESRPSALLSPQARLLMKLQHIGLLDEHGLLQHPFTSLNPLNQEQMERLFKVCQKRLFHDEMQVTHSSVKEHYSYHLSLLNRLGIDPQESYLAGEAAAYVLGITDYFVAIVKTYLRASPYDDDYCDEELEALISQGQNQPSNIEFIDYLNTIDLNTLEKLQKSYVGEPDHEFFQEIRLFSQSSCDHVLRISYGQESFVIRNIGNVLNPHSHTRDAFLIPVKFFLNCTAIRSFETPRLYPSSLTTNFHQGVIDYSLKLLRRTGHRQPIPPSSTIYLQIQGYTPSVVNPIKTSSKEDLHRLKLLQIETKCNAVALAFTASQGKNSEQAHQIFTSLCANFLPLHPILVEIKDLIINDKLPFDAVNAILLFTGWVQACLPSVDWQKQMKIAVHLQKEKYGYFLSFDFEDCQLKVALQPYQALEQLMASLKSLDAASNLCKLLIPAKVNHLDPSEALINFFDSPVYFEYFRSISLNLLSVENHLLNRIGYSCVLASLALVGQPSGIQFVFNKFFDLFPLEGKILQQEFSLLATKLTPKAPFLGTRDAVHCLFQFITHLFLHQNRNYALTLWHHYASTYQVASKDQVSFLSQLFYKAQSIHGPEETLHLFKPILPKLEEPVVVELLERVFCHIKTSSPLIKPFILMTQSLFKYPFSTDSSGFLSHLLQVAIQNGLFSYVEKALSFWAKGMLFAQEEWEYLCHTLYQEFLSTTSLHVEARLLENRLHAIRPFTKEKEAVLISEEELLKLSPVERVLTLQQAPTIPLSKIKQIRTADLLHLIENANQDLLTVLTTSSFSDQLFEMDKIIPALLSLFSKNLPSKKEVMHFSFLLQVAKTPLLKKQTLSIADQLLKHVNDFPLLVSQQELILELIAYALEALPHDQPVQKGFVEELVSLLERSYRQEKPFQEKICHIIASSERCLFSILTNHAFFKEAIHLLCIMDCYKIPKANTSIKEDELLQLSYQTIALKEESLSRMLLRCLPYLKNSGRFISAKNQEALFRQWIAVFEKSEEMLSAVAPHLNALFLSTDNPSDLLTALMQTFQSKEEAFNFFLLLPGIKRKLFFELAHRYLFPQVPVTLTLSIIQLHSTEFKDPSLQPILDCWLKKALEDRVPVSDIICILDCLSYWDFTLLKEVIQRYPSAHEFLFNTLKSLNTKGRLKLLHKQKKLASKNKKVLFQQLFVHLLRNKSFPKALLDFAFDGNFDLFPSKARESLLNEYLSKVLEVIASSSGGYVDHLQALAGLAERSAALEEDIKFKLFFIMVKNNQLVLPANRLLQSLLSHQVTDKAVFENLLVKLIEDHWDFISEENFLPLKAYVQKNSSRLAHLLKRQWRTRLIRRYHECDPHSQIPDDDRMIDLVLSCEDRKMILLAYYFITEVLVFNPSKLKVIFSIWQRAFLLVQKIDTDEQRQDVLIQFISFLKGTLKNGPNLEHDSIRDRLFPALKEVMTTLLLFKNERALSHHFTQLFVHLIALEPKNLPDRCYFQEYWKELISTSIKQPSLKQHLNLFASNLNRILKNAKATIFDFWSDAFDCITEKGSQEHLSDILECFFIFLEESPKLGPDLSTALNRDLLLTPIHKAMLALALVEDDDQFERQENKFFTILQKLELQNGVNDPQRYVQGYRLLFITMLLEKTTPSPTLLKSVVRSFKSLSPFHPQLALLFRMCIKDFIHRMIALGPNYPHAFQTFLEAERTWEAFLKQERGSAFVKEYQRLSLIIHQMKHYAQIFLPTGLTNHRRAEWNLKAIEEEIQNILVQHRDLPISSQETKYSKLQKITSLLRRTAPLLSLQPKTCLTSFHLLFKNTTLAHKQKKITDIESLKIIRQFLRGLDLDEIQAKKELYRKLFNLFLKELFNPVLEGLTQPSTRQQPGCRTVETNASNLLEEEISSLIFTLLESLYTMKGHGFFDHDFKFYVETVKQIMPYLPIFFQNMTEASATIIELISLFPMNYKDDRDKLISALMKMAPKEVYQELQSYLQFETQFLTEWHSHSSPQLIAATKKILTWADEPNEKNKLAIAHTKIEHMYYLAFSYFKQAIPSLTQDHGVFLKVTEGFFSLLISPLKTELTKEDLTKSTLGVHFINEFFSYLNERGLDSDWELYLSCVLSLFNDYTLPMLEIAERDQWNLVRQFLKNLVLFKNKGLFKNHFSQYLGILKKIWPFLLANQAKSMQEIPYRDYISPLIANFPTAFSEDRQKLALSAAEWLERLKIDQAKDYANKIKKTLKNEERKSARC
ncbi:MAG: hypothetical protein ACSNEK_03035 [Parachlamydiaceae bacterium]